jgi:hypothetical protein
MVIGTQQAGNSVNERQTSSREQQLVQSQLSRLQTAEVRDAFVYA